MSFSLNPFLQTAVISVNVIGLWDAYLLLRQRRALKTKEIPPYFTNSYTDEEFSQTQAYGVECSTFSLFQQAKSLVTGNLSIFLRLSSRLYYLVSQCTGLTAGSFSHNYTVAVIGDLVSTTLDIPFSYYDNFHREKRYGFNTMTKTEFVKDIVKSLLLRAAFLYPVSIKLVQFVVQRFGERFPLYLFSGMSVMLLFFLLAMPTVIQPLFNKYTPLDPESSTYKKILQLCEKLNFPVKSVLVVDGSRRSHHSNAYFYGFGRKHIVLYDTLLEQLKGDDEGLLAVLCHELGHWKHNHMYVNIAVTLGQLMLFCYGARLVIFNKLSYEAFGFREVDPVMGISIFAEVFYTPVDMLIRYAFCYISRRNEFQADRFAVTMGYCESLKRGLLKIMKENRGSLTSDPLYSAFHHTHPPVLERLQAIDEELKKQK
ncbi:hypothetical protein JKF63_03170 [Porcisia hertigi]|uniref:CAAX prenyl protease n=1 Tax=Porcisia hertigi TaxID=2761500 RepID=A0A836IRW9_9TRYP|nr:hypothetical protein JKF63_03170 [Porcisia hertigi]